MRTLHPADRELVEAAILAQQTVMVCGGPSAGKSTTLRGLATAIPPERRIVSIEATLELHLDDDVEAHPDCVAMQTRAANLEGRGELSSRDLFREALRMSPDVLIVGEVRGPQEALPMLMSVAAGGAAGSLSTIHARSSAHALAMLQTYVLMGAERLPFEASAPLIASSIDLVLHVERRLDERGKEHRVVSSSPGGVRLPRAHRHDQRGELHRQQGAARHARSPELGAASAPARGRVPPHPPGSGVTVLALSVLLGAGFGLGVFLLVAALGRGGQEGAAGGALRRRRRSWRADPESWLVQGGLGVIAGVAVGLITGWVVAGLAALAAGLALPAIRRNRQAQRAQLARAEALPAWCEMLRDTLTGSAHGLETVIKVTASVAPLPLRADTDILVSNLGRLSLDDSLRAFAERVADPVCDQVVMGLLVRGSGDLASVLSSIAASARQELEVRGRVEAGRSGLRWTARVIIGITLLLAGGIALIHGDYLAVYSTPLGEVLLAVVVGVFAAGLWLMERVTRGAPPPRLLSLDTEAQLP